MKRKRTLPRPRNGHVAAIRLRKSGAHLKSRKAERRAETVALKRMDRDVPGRANPSPSAPDTRSSLKFRMRPVSSYGWYARVDGHLTVNQALKSTPGSNPGPPTISRVQNTQKGA